MSTPNRFCWLIASFLFVGQVNAQAPNLINFQSKIDGLTSETASITFSLYDTPDGGSPIWTESHASVSVIDGFVRVLLGSETDFPENAFYTSGERYLQLVVNGESFSPRLRLTSVAYALRADAADTISGGYVESINGANDEVEIVGGDNVTVTRDGQDIIVSASGGMSGGITTLQGDNSIDITSPNGPTTTVSLSNDVTIGPSGELSVTNGGGGTAAELSSESEGGALFIKQTDGNFNAVEASVRAGGNQGLGGQFKIRGNNNWDAINMFADGDTEGGRVVMREPNPSNANESFSTLVLRGEEGAGQILTLGGNSTQISIGGEKQEIRSLGRMGLGLTQAEFDSDASLGVELFVRGNVAITGNLTGGVNIEVDHPVDPAAKEFRHAAVISSEMMTVYHGNAVLNSAGEAVVILPDWFQAFNKDFRYQLTCIGGYAPVYIAERIENNQFRIAGGTQGLEISWQVTGVRNDAFAQQQPLQVESAKSVDR